MKLSDIKTFPARVESRSSGNFYTLIGKYWDKYVVWGDEDFAPIALSDIGEYNLIKPKKTLHKYLMRSTDSHLPLRPILTFHFESKEDFEYYKNQHSYELISYEGEVEVNDATGI